MIAEKAQASLQTCTDLPEPSLLAGELTSETSCTHCTGPYVLQVINSSVWTNKFLQGLHRLEIYLNIEGFLEKSLTLKLIRLSNLTL